VKISVITPTHDLRWLQQAWDSLRAQSHADFEWRVFLNNIDPDGPPAPSDRNLGLADVDDRVIVHRSMLRTGGSVGAVKGVAFGLAGGDVVLELDHDDMLHPHALARVAEAFVDPGVDFVYSDCADFSDPPGLRVTYHDPAVKASWLTCNWSFADCDVPENLRAHVGAERLVYPITFEPSALSVSLISYAPNHLRAWRRSFYERIGGHDASLKVCDDLDLLQRTYLAGRMRKIPEVLYFYRVAPGANTWAKQIPNIQAASAEMQARRLQALVEREMSLRGLPCLDLGGAHGTPGAPWIPVDAALPWPAWIACTRAPPETLELADKAWRDAGIPLGQLGVHGTPWPFPDSSIGAFRAVDFLEHLPNKLHTMSELHRCLAPGGWLLSSTPDGCGPGAHQDPTHCSYWVEDSFRYYTEQRLARYIDNTTERFMAARLLTERGKVPYVHAALVSLKDDDGRLPGQRMI